MPGPTWTVLPPDDWKRLITGLVVSGAFVLPVGIYYGVIGVVRLARWVAPSARERRSMLPPWLLLRAFLIDPRQSWSYVEIADLAALSGSSLRLCLARLERSGWVESHWVAASQGPGRTPRIRRYRLTADGQAHAGKIGRRPGNQALRGFAAPLNGRHAYARAADRAKDFSFADEAAEVLEHARRLAQRLQDPTDDAERCAEDTRKLNLDLKDFASRTGVGLDPRGFRVPRRPLPNDELNPFDVAGLSDPVGDLIVGVIKAARVTHGPVDELARDSGLAYKRDRAVAYLRACTCSRYVVDVSMTAPYRLVGDIHQLIGALDEVRTLYLTCRAAPTVAAPALPGRILSGLISLGTLPIPPPDRPRYREEFVRDLYEHPRPRRPVHCYRLLAQARRLRAVLLGPPK